MKIIYYIVVILFVIILGWAGFTIWKEIVIKNVNFTNFSDFLVLEKKDKKIIKEYVILENYIYSDDKAIQYKKEKNKLIKIFKNRVINKRIYDEYWHKKNNIYDIFIYKWNSYEINTDKMYKYDFVELLDKFNIAPYYDPKNNTLYIASHSSGKLYNLWLIFFKMKVGDTIKFYDEKKDILDTFKVVERKIVPKDVFYNKVFLSLKNKIVFFTCYPFNSTAYRLYIVAEKVNE